MLVERRFNYPWQIIKEASGIDAYQKNGSWAGVEAFMTPLSRRLNSGRSHIISPDIVSHEIVFYMIGPAFIVGLLENNILLGLGLKLSLNIIEHVTADIASYLSYKRERQRLLEEIIRTERLPFP